jgi:hypothetical protein
VLEDEGGSTETPDSGSEPERRFGEDALVLTAVGLTLAALLSILALVAVQAQAVGVRFGDRVLNFAQTGPFGQFGFGLLAVAALALACVAPVDDARRRLVDGLRALVGLVAAVAVVLSGYGVVAFATDAAIGHTQYMSTWGPALRAGAVGLGLSSMFLAACALWLVSRRVDAEHDEPVGDAELEAFPRAQRPVWGAVSGAAALAMLGALALLELVAEPVFHSKTATSAALDSRPASTRRRARSARIRSRCWRSSSSVWSSARARERICAAHRCSRSRRSCPSSSLHCRCSSSYE